MRLARAARCAAVSETVATGPAMAAGAAATAADRAPPLLRSVVSAPASAGLGSGAGQPARGALRAVQLPSPTDATRQAGSSHPQQPSIFAFNHGATPPAVPSLGLLPLPPVSGSGAKAGAAGGLVETPVGSPMPAHALSSTQPSPILAGFEPMSPAAPHPAASLGGGHNLAAGGTSNGAASNTAAAGLMLPPPSAVVGTEWSAALPGRATAKGLSGGPQARAGEELPPAQYLEALVNR